LFGFCEVIAFGQVVNAFVEQVMLVGELAELVVALEQLSLHFLDVWHFRLL
jgi:hypothetical protein